jgi:hypothetical protein
MRPSQNAKVSPSEGRNDSGAASPVYWTGAPLFLVRSSEHTALLGLATRKLTPHGALFIASASAAGRLIPLFRA